MSEININIAQDMEKLKQDHIQLSNLVQTLVSEQNSHKLQIEVLKFQLEDVTEKLEQQSAPTNSGRKPESKGDNPTIPESEFGMLFQAHDLELRRLKDFLEVMRDQEENQNMTYRFMTDALKNKYETLENSINEKFDHLNSNIAKTISSSPDLVSEIDIKLDHKLAELAEKLLNNPKQGKESKSQSLASEIIVRQVMEQQKLIRNEIAENNLKVADLHAAIDGFKEFFSEQISTSKVETQVAIASLNETIKKAFENILALENKVSSDLIPSTPIDNHLVETLKDEVHLAQESIIFLENKLDHILQKVYIQNTSQDKYISPSKSDLGLDERVVRSPKKDIDRMNMKLIELESKLNSMNIEFESKFLTLRINILADIFENVSEDADDPTLTKLNFVEAKFGKMLYDLNSAIKQCIDATEDINSNVNMTKGPNLNRASVTTAEVQKPTEVAKRLSFLPNRESRFLYSNTVPVIQEEEIIDAKRRISTLEGEIGDEKIVENKEDDRESQGSVTSVDEKKPGAVKARFESLSALIKQMSLRVNSLETAVNHIQEQQPGTIMSMNSSMDRGLNETEIAKIWETINSLIHNTQEQFERIKASQPKKGHSRQGSKEFDLSKVHSELGNDLLVQQKLESFVNPLVEKINEHVNALFERITQQENQVKKVMDEKEEVLRVFAQQKEETINKMVEGSQLYKMIFNKGSYHMKDSNKAPLDMLAENFRGVWDTINLLSERILTVEQLLRPDRRISTFKA